MIDTENYADDIRTAVVHSVLLDFESMRDVVSRTKAGAVRDELQATLDTDLQPAVDRVVGAESAAETLRAAEEYSDKRRLFVMEKVQGDRQERLLKRCDAMAAALRSYQRIDLRAAEQLRRLAEDLVARLDNSATVQSIGALVTQLGQLATQLGQLATQDGQLATQLGDYTSSLQSIIQNSQADQEATASAIGGTNNVLTEIEHTLRRSMEELVGPLHVARYRDANQTGGPAAAAAKAVAARVATSSGGANSGGAS